MLRKVQRRARAAINCELDGDNKLCIVLVEVFGNISLCSPGVCVQPCRIVNSFDYTHAALSWQKLCCLDKWNGQALSRF